MAGLAEEIGSGGQSIVAKELNVFRNTIRKGSFELKSGFRIVDSYHMRHRKRIEEHVVGNII